MSLNFASISNRSNFCAGNNFKKNNLKTIGFSGQELITPEVTQKLQLISDEINTANKIAVFTHNNPDGDAAGSAAAMKNLISSKYPDKKVDVFIMDAIPQGFKCLKDSESFEYINKKSNIESIKARNYDLAISVDCAEIDMMRDSSKIFDSAKRKVKIDHHSDGKDYADINLTCGDASSASQVVLLLADHMGVKLNKDLASDIYLGLVTDTQGFRFMNKPVDVFEDASKLAKTNFDTRNVYASSMDYMSKAAVKFYANVLNNIQYSKDGKIAYFIDDKTVNKKGIEKADVKDLFLKVVGQVMPNIEGVKVAVKIASNDSCTSGSLRGNGVAVNKLAEKLGGGGHEFAAGFGITENAPPPEQVLNQITDYFKKTGTLN